MEIRESDLRSLLDVIDKEMLNSGKIFKITDLKYHSGQVTKKSFLRFNKVETVYFIDSFNVVYYDDTEDEFKFGHGNLDWLQELVFYYNLNYLRKDYIKYRKIFEKYQEYCNKNK